ncbi:MAG: putative acid phosphatase [Actinomycetia bacterium]|nr:putative acid phosphatase [Actinomycetes bacterium]
MRILVTNDDGIGSQGLRVLAERLAAAGHDVFVVAPTGERSGAGAAIGPLHQAGPMPVIEHEWPALGGPAFAIDAPPAAAVYAACLGGFGAAPDIVVSGINPGPNTGHLVLHSGTVGAAMTGAVLGVPSLAVSIGIGQPVHWATAAEYAAGAVDWVLERADTPLTLNMNVPNTPLEEIKGVREAELARYGSVWAATASGADGYVSIEFAGSELPAAPGTDLAVLLDGYVAVTPLACIERYAPADDPSVATGAAATIAARLAQPA